MRIVVNDEPTRVAPATTVAELLVALGYGDATVAVAVDGVFVPRTEHGRTVLAEGSKVEIVAPMAGG